MFREIPEYSRFSRFVATLFKTFTDPASDLNLDTWIGTVNIYSSKNDLGLRLQLGNAYSSYRDIQSRLLTGQMPIQSFNEQRQTTEAKTY